jgi:hypothetical protein
VGDLNRRDSSFGCIGNNKNGLLLQNFLIEHEAVFLNHPKNYTYHKYNSEYKELLDIAIGSPLIASTTKYCDIEDDSLLKSYHLPIKIQIDLAINKSPQSTKDPQRLNYNKADWSNYKSLLTGLEPSPNLSVNELDDWIVNNISRAANESIPKNSNNNNKQLPSHIITKIKEKRKLRRKHAITHDLNLKSAINKLNEEIKQLIMNKNSSTWEKFITDINKRSTSTRLIWTKIDNMRQAKVKSSIPTLIHNNKSYTDDLDKANLFSSCLAETFRNSDQPEFDANFKNKIENETIEWLNNPNTKLESGKKQITKAELNAAIKGLSSKKTSDQRGTNNLLIKAVPICFRRHILELFNKINNQNNFPTTWKESEIFMLPKKTTDKNNVKSYRPISITSCLARLNEKIIKERLTFALNSTQTISKNQSGFRKNRQTKDNIFFLIQKGLECRNRGWKAILILFDIMSAFDKVWHIGLIAKMIKYKIPDYIIHWCYNFITNRSFRVKINNKLSDPKPIETGVPQGAVLSPLLFSIFINDATSENSTNNTYNLLFADDICYLKLFKSSLGVEKNINLYLKELENWLNRWRLKMAIPKCAAMVIEQSNSNSKFDLKLYKEKIPMVEVQTFLGIKIDRHLRFDNHIEMLSAKTNGRINILKILSHKSWRISQTALINIYKALMRSILDYSALLNNFLKIKLTQKIQIIQNTALRIILKKGRDTSIKMLHQLANIDLIKDRMQKLCKAYFVKCIANENPLFLDCWNEYQRFANGRILKSETIICAYKSFIIEQINISNSED